MNIKLTKAEVKRLNSKNIKTIVPIHCFYNNQWAELLQDEGGYFIYYYYEVYNHREESIINIDEKFVIQIKTEALKFSINDANRTLCILNFINKNKKEFWDGHISENIKDNKKKYRRFKMGE